MRAPYRSALAIPPVLPASNTGAKSDIEYWDIALRDFGLMVGALALFLLANAYARRRKLVK